MQVPGLKCSNKGIRNKNPNKFCKSFNNHLGKKSYFLSGPATKAFAPPPLAKWP